MGNTRPIPLFDGLTYLDKASIPSGYVSNNVYQHDFHLAIQFLKQYTSSDATFRAYRREIERLIQWTWLIAKRSLLTLTHTDIEQYIAFCRKPKPSWIGTKTVPRFLTDSQHQRQRIPNPAWHLFVATVSKADFKYGIKPEKKHYQLSTKSLREIFTAIGSFYTYLVNEGSVEYNPVTLVRQKSQSFIKQPHGNKITKLSKRQWHYCLLAAETLACKDAAKYERTLFIMSALYLMYLRISELSANHDWTPQMGHFYRDAQNQWWFKTLGNGNEIRTISVSDDMLVALRRYRKHLALSPLPGINEAHPLIPSLRGQRAIKSKKEIRNIIQICFDSAVEQLRHKHLIEDADDLEHASVRWLRHTGISDDINLRRRPITHVGNDAGHNSILTTDRYNDGNLHNRYSSAKNKKRSDPIVQPN